MKLDTFTFQLMIISLPGIIALFISYNLIVRKRDDNFSRILLIFVYSTLSYLVTDCILSVSVDNHKELIGKLFLGKPVIDPAAIFLSCIVATVIALIHSYLSNYAILNRFAQIIRCSKRFGDIDVWQYFNNAPISQKHDGWLYVRDHKQNLTYYGYITHYSDSGADTISTPEEFEETKKYIELSYNKFGG
ncbi:MAG: hypothetical protein KOO65_00355 [Desulfobacterales bacterium]|nr:hypothetical protein [Desulfobacterales bacterium]